MSKSPHVLANANRFNGFSQQDLVRIEQLPKSRQFAPENTILNQGEGGIVLLIILDGRVRIVHTTADNQEREVAMLGPGHAFGEMALFGERARRSATYVAVEPTECLVLHRLDFLAHLRKHPDIAFDSSTQ